MKKSFTLLVVLIFSVASVFAQGDTVYRPKDTVNYDLHNADTMKIGNILIIKMKKKGDTANVVSIQKKAKKAGLSWMAFDLGFSNFNDNTNYATVGNYVAQSPGGPAFGNADLDPKTGKSMNVNIWFVTQRVPIVPNNLFLRYGLGVELNNYRFRSPISFKEGGALPYNQGQTNAPYVFRDSISFSKNKLALDYVTVPLMLDLSPNNSKLSIAAGASIGYLYSQRNKQISNERGKEKNRGDYDVEKFKLSYVGEVGLGNIALYGSYSPKSIFERDLNVKPFNVGLRFNFF